MDEKRTIKKGCITCGYNEDEEGEISPGLFVGYCPKCLDFYGWREQWGKLVPVANKFSPPVPKQQNVNTKE